MIRTNSFLEMFLRTFFSWETSMSNRLRYPVYRCEKCKRLLTRLEIVRKWEKAEAEPNITASIALCVCGSGRISPTNLTQDEENRFGSYWQKFRFFVLRRRDEDTRILEQWWADR